MCIIFESYLILISNTNLEKFKNRAISELFMRALLVWKEKPNFFQSFVDDELYIAWQKRMSNFDAQKINSKIMCNKEFYNRKLNSTHFLHLINFATLLKYNLEGNSCTWENYENFGRFYLYYLGFFHDLKTRKKKLHTLLLYRRCVVI